MSLEAEFARLLEPLTSEIRTLRAEVIGLRQTLISQDRQITRPVYDAKQLQEELGFSEDQAYALLRSHGYKQGGRRRITADRLMDYTSGRP